MSPRRERFWLGAYRLLLRAWPAELRREFGEDMLLLFRDRLRETWTVRRPLTRCRFTWRTLRDVIGAGLRERWEKAFGTTTLREEAARRRNRRIPPEERPRDAWFDTLRLDIRFGLRMLRRNPLFTAVAILCFGIGIGANATIFSFLFGLMANPLQLEEPRTLISCELCSITQGWTTSVTYPDFLDWREQNTVFDALTAWHEEKYTLTGGGGDPERIAGLTVSPDFTAAMRIEPLLGRGFLPEDELPGAPGVVILSHRFWAERYAGDTGIIGGTMTLDSETRTIVGIMPAGFHFPESTELWLPLRRDRGLPRSAQYLRVAGRLRDGITIEQAAADMRAIAEGLAQRYPVTNRDKGVLLQPLDAVIVGETREVIVIFYVVVTFVLLLACANVANLVLARSSARQHEIAVRAGLGAGRFRLMRMLITESVVLALAGGLLGLVLGRVGGDLIVNAVPVELPYWVRVEMHLPVIAIMTGISLVTGLLAGTGPAWMTIRNDLAGRLQEGGGRATGGRRRSAFRSGLVVTEVGLALVLLIGATLMLHGAARVRAVEPGFSAGNVLTMRLELPLYGHRDAGGVARFYDEVLDRIRAHPAVSAASAATILPFADSNEVMGYVVEGGPELDPTEAPDAYHRIITPGFFTTLDIPLLRGRDFTPADRFGSAEQVAIVSRRLAELSWPGADPIGERISYASFDTAAAGGWMTVVGVVEDICQRELIGEVTPCVYRPLSQAPRTFASLAVRTTGDPLALVRPVRDILRDIDPALPPYDIITLEEYVRRQNWEPPVFGWMFGIFSSIALLLAMIGVYGVVAYTVTERAREFGIRMTLGAGPGQILRLVLAQGAGPIGLGLIGGTVLAFIGLRFAASIFFGVSATEPLFYAAAIAAMAAAALLATWLPARRATALDPITTLRVE